MKLADLESREVLLSKLAGAMKGTMAKAARTFDALRIKLEEGAPAAAPVVEAVSAEADVVAEAAPAAEAPVETAAEAVETPVVEAEAVVAEATETPAE
jgi:large subunit ribosomal protein L10